MTPSRRPHLGVLLGGHQHLGGEPHRLLVVDVHVRRVLAGPRRPAPALHPRDLCSRGTLSDCQSGLFPSPLKLIEHKPIFALVATFYLSTHNLCERLKS